VDRVEAITEVMAATEVSPEVQVVQTRFRVGLVDQWRIPAGASVLEVGCGQGDMTAVLAEAVGERGRVVGVDIAEPTYGAPVTLGESAEFLRSTPLGARVDIRFGFDVLDEANSFAADTFDYVVLSHCSWYFASVDQLTRTLARVRPWARHLCFAEWDLRPNALSQLPHLLAVLIQGQVEATGERATGNIRSPFSQQSLLRALTPAGWRTTAQHPVDAGSLQDADWEIGYCLRPSGVVTRLPTLPEPMREFVTSQLDVLRAVALERGNDPLPSYLVTADRR
jgi:SAM-dependent methyltransferase